MKTREYVINHLIQNKIIAILRGIYDEQALWLCRALHKGGIRFVEVTFDQQCPNCSQKTAATIAALCEAMEDEMCFGAGTVLTQEQVIIARQAGARYIISPNTSKKIIQLTRELELVSIPGAMTPSEMIAADQAGADFVKVFPVYDLGLTYMKSVRAPISHIKFIATGGVNEENCAEYLQTGFAGAGISGRLTERKLLAAMDFEEFSRRAEVFAKIASGVQK